MNQQVPPKKKRRYWLWAIIAFVAVGIIGQLTMTPETRQKLAQEETDKRIKDSTQAASPAGRVAQFDKDCIDPWDGSIRVVNKSIKMSLNDPSSFEHVETIRRPHTNAKSEVDYLTFVTTFRAKNGFNATITSRAVGKIDMNCNILSIKIEK